ncbi:GNAT family N-acetyltransferase [Flavobacterium sp. Fl-77]|uniref:GNAT family N-acetyltransferase n=1 Tax=Flavobacterium flavipigmentatum TaxID=2893884 RepID=A0AAJ2S8J8_9FLAO|nr:MULTISPECIES: GNAT family N-acetyltransferase [unclassified Flavobacterium]MDX6183304.1 GNAT family N-acetyltransferase [Flavobacterium sp. Fl-33]MDX6186588.1 GNAT family N-acetyltransferase [Flavobacterium sp. Fl-77]UFH38642.1 GNAT family N-acetyltransferase [Flavobacterium sp. F-70]
METIVIKKIGLSELEKLQKIGKQTFSETFAAINSEENMKQYLTEKFSLEKLTDELTNSNSEFYFALLEEKIVGYLKVNFAAAQTELKDKNALEIERIYVLKEHKGNKIGQLLYEKALQVAQKSSLKYIWLGVWEENHGALHFYKKNGFIAFDKHIFRLGDDEQTDLLMKLMLK